MTLFFSKNKKIERAITFFLLIFFNVSSLAVAASPVLCIAQDETHVLAQEQLFLEGCHTINDSFQDACATSRKNQDTPCVDIAINSNEASISPRQLKSILPQSPVGTWFIAPASLAKKPLDAAYPPNVNVLPSQFPLTSLQTVVLLI